MNKTLLAVVLLSCAVSLWAQGVPEKGNKPPADKKVSVQPLPAEAIPTGSAERKAAAQAALEAEDSVVMIDSKSEGDEGGSAEPAAVQTEPAAPGSMPASYGDCKGVLNEGGRSVLVFESPENGTISFVQVTVGKDGVSWKLLGRIPRNAG